MLVKTQCKGRAYTGVSVSDNAVRRYFPYQTESVELELDHLLIRCGLDPKFWDGQPEIADPRLSAWLESKNFNWKPGEERVPLAMIPLGENVFRLQTFPVRKGRRGGMSQPME